MAEKRKRAGRTKLTCETQGKSLGYRFINALSVMFLTAMILDVAIIVAGRFIFQRTPGWGEPVALLCVIWFSLLSSANALSDNRHLRVAYFLDRFPSETRKILNVVFYIIFFMIAVFLIFQGIEITWQTRNNMIPGLNISQAARYAAIPVSGIAMLIVLIKKVIRKELI